MFRITSYGRTATKSIDLISKQKKSCTCSTHFCTFLCVALHDCNRELYRPCTTTTWKCLIASFMEDVNKRRRISFSLSKLECSPQEMNSREIRLHFCHFQQIGINATKIEKTGILLNLTFSLPLPSSMLKLPDAVFYVQHTFLYISLPLLCNYNAVLYG